MTPTSQEDLKLLVQLIRRLRGWDQLDLGTEAGLDESTISRYERGRLTPRPPTLERLAAAAGVPMWLLDTVLLPVLRMAQHALHGDAPASRTDQATLGAAGARPLPAAAADGGEEPGHGAIGERLAGSIVAAAEVAFGFLVAEADAELGEASSVRAQPSPLDRAEAPELWESLAPCTPEERRWLVAQLPEFQSWALVEELAEQSRRAAADDAAVAAELAALAIRVAKLVPGEEGWRRRLQGYATAFLANARRVAGNLKEADSLFAKAWTLWLSGATADPSCLLAEWRLLDMEASLRREQGQFATALRLLDRARAAAPPEAEAHILLNGVFTLEKSGDFAGALQALRDVAPLVEQRAEPRERWMLAFHVTLNLVDLGRFEDAAAALPAVQQQAAALGNELDTLRVQWLAGRIANAQGRTAQALSALEEVRAEFAKRRNPTDTALVTLELAVLYLEQGRTREVRELAAAMAWVFNAEGIRRELVASLRLFCEAAALEAATVEQATRLIAAVREAGGPCCEAHG